MTIQIPSTIEFTPVRLLVSAGVRYWEDTEVNGISDKAGTLIPFRSGDLWRPAIELATGKVLNWPTDTTADIHYKVCDAGEYHLEDKEGRRAKYKGDYVPDILAVGERGFGDYIILKITAEGVIEGWKEPQLDDEDWELQK
jgi:hypothetical protein